MKVCCISAKARHGKDTAAAMMAEYLEKRGHKVLITHFADLLKYICKQFFGWNGDKDVAGRTLLQYVGTDVVGAQKPGYWANFLADFLKMFEKEWDFVIVPDCRYPIEYELIRDTFEAVLLRVERPGFDNGLSAAQKAHASETALDEYNFDTIIYNSGSLEELRDKLTEYANTI
jgi:hypothetical protein